jgi:hypothetical protein
MKRILLLLALVMILAACGPKSENNDPSPYIGPELELSSDVYIREINFDPETMEGLYEILEGSLDLVTYIKAGNKLNLEISDDGLGGTGEIRNGKLSYSIGEPDGELIPIEEVLTELLSDVGSLPAGVNLPDYSVSSDTAQAVPLYLLIDGDPEYIALSRERITSTSTFSNASPPFSFTVTVEMVNFIYVDEGVNVSVSPFSYETTYSDLTDEELPSVFPFEDIPIKLTIDRINLNLQEGWNAIHSTLTLTLTMTMAGYDFSYEASGKLNVKGGNPSSLYWVLTSEDDGSLPLP